jgi:hypothetical protein
MILVALDTRGLPAADLQEGFEELACSPKFFIDHIVRNPKTKRMNRPLAEICGLTKSLLLTLDPTTGYARFNVQGAAYVMYDDGNYPLLKEQVWGLCELANEAIDVLLL